VAGASTYVQTVNVAMTGLPKVGSDRLDIGGYAGGIGDTYFNILPAPVLMPNYDANSYRAAVVVISEWQWFKDGSTQYADAGNTSNPVLGYS